MKKHLPADHAKDLLLEIGTEELPSRFVPPALEALAQTAKARFEALGLAYESLKALGGPRRLALLVTGLSPKGKDLVQENLGPGLAQAKDAEGNWTPAAQGFARSQGVPLEKLETRKTEKGERLCAVRRTEGASAAKVLPELLPELIRKIPFAKNMVWEESGFSFARPIRWIVALHGTTPVKFSIAGVKSGRKSWGLTLQSTKPLDVPSPARYAAMLRDRCVTVDPAERRSQIEKQILHVVKPMQGHVPLEKFGDLLDEVVHLVEHPVAILGRFDPRHLALPPEILITSMKKHQKFFPVFDTHGNLLPHFVGIRNGISDNQGVVREGYERVLAARLADAAFFFGQDRQGKLEDKAPALKGVLFQKALGTLWGKTERVIKLSADISSRLSLDHDVSGRAARAAYLAKADLVTAVVGEFPELQGVMGRIYAAADGLPSPLPESVEQHYWPLTAEGPLPRETEAAVVSLADKFDTLAGDFLVGLVPTGSQDPYGLRRAAVGALRILADRGWGLDLPDFLGAALSSFPDEVKGDREKTRQTLLDFLKQRWSALMEAKGFRSDEIQAVLALPFKDVVDAARRLEALQAVRRHPDFTPLAAAFKRASNILTQAKQKGLMQNDSSIDAARLEEPAERALFEVLEKLEGGVAPLLGKAQYREALQGLVVLRGPVDQFFEKVMVMAPETEKRDNRLALLARIAGLFRRVELALLQDVPEAGKLPK